MVILRKGAAELRVDIQIELNSYLLSLPLLSTKMHPLMPH